MKSLLLLRGDSLDGYEAALESGAGSLIVDIAALRLSPATAGIAGKLLNRSLTCASRPRLVVLVGPLSGSIGMDLDLAMAVAPDAVLLSEAVGGADLQHLAAKLAVREAEGGLVDGATRIIGLVADTARGVLALGTIAGASPRLAGVAWRMEATACDQAGSNAPDRLARALTLVAASAAEVEAIEAASPGHDLDALARDCETARRDGFAAKFALDATQVSIINAA